MLVSENQRQTSLMSLTSTGTSCDVIKDSFCERYAESYVAAMEHFFDVVQGGTQFSVHARLLLRCLFYSCSVCRTQSPPKVLHL